MIFVILPSRHCERMIGWCKFVELMKKDPSKITIKIGRTSRYGYSVIVDEQKASAEINRPDESENPPPSHRLPDSSLYLL